MIRPEINSIKYWVHIPIIVIVASIFVHYSFGYGMWDLEETIKISAGVALGDILAHTLLKFD